MAVRFKKCSRIRLDCDSVTRVSGYEMLLALIFLDWLRKQPCFSCCLVHPSFFFILLVFCLLSCFRPLGSDIQECAALEAPTVGSGVGVGMEVGDRPQEMWPQLTGQAVKAGELKVREQNSV